MAATLGIVEQTPIGLEVRVEIDSREPIGGWVDAGHRRSRFDGWLQLISALEKAAAELEAGAPEHEGRDA